MRYSLISRDWIADCVEIMHEAYSAVSNAYINIVSVCTMILCVYRMLWSVLVGVIKQVSIHNSLLTFTNGGFLLFVHSSWSADADCSFECSKKTMFVYKMNMHTHTRMHTHTHTHTYTHTHIHIHTCMHTHAHTCTHTHTQTTHTTLYYR